MRKCLFIIQWGFIVFSCNRQTLRYIYKKFYNHSQNNHKWKYRQESHVPPKLCVMLPPTISPNTPPKANIDEVPWPTAILSFGKWVWTIAKTRGNIDIPMP